MKKQAILRKISLLLAIVIVVSMALTGCSGNKDPHKSDHTVSVLSTAIRTMSDSAFTDYELIKKIYIHAFSSTQIISESFLPEDLADTLPQLFGDAPSEELVNSLVLYGGKTIGDKTIGELKPTKALKQKQLYVGDLLFVNANNANAYYIYDKDGLVNLSSPLEEVDTAAVLDSLPESEQFAVLRPMRNMDDYDLVEGDLPELELTEAQQALVATAQSYLLRGDKAQYVSYTGGPYTGNYVEKKAPEDFTSDNYGSLQCAGFCYDVYYQALGMQIKFGSNKLFTSTSLISLSPHLDIQKYVMDCQTSDAYTEEQREQIADEIIELLEPGDILVVTRASGGHVMLYVGNEIIIHSSGSSYDDDTKTEVYEATVRQMRFRDYFCREGAGGYLFGSETGRLVEKFYVVRPLDLWDGEIPETTKNRIENLQGIMAQKTSSHNISLTADVGEEITYTFELYNQNDEEVTLDVSDVVPEKTQYVSGADNVDGDNLSWQVTIPPNTRKKVSYVVKVAADAQKGDEIRGESGIVGGVPVNCPSVTVNNTLTQEEIQTLKDTINTYQPADITNGFEMVNDIYKKAFGWESVFEDTDFDTVFYGENGVYLEETKWVALRDDTKYGQMVAPNLSGGYGTKEKKQGMPVVMPAREQQFVVGDVLICKMGEEQHLYIYAGDGAVYDLMNGFTLDERTVQGRMEYFLRTDYGYAVLRPSLIAE